MEPPTSKSDRKRIAKAAAYTIAMSLLWREYAAPAMFSELVDLEEVRVAVLELHNEMSARRSRNPMICLIEKAKAE